MTITLTPRWMGGHVAFPSSVNGKLLRGFKEGNSTIQFPLKKKKKERERERKEERRKKEKEERNKKEGRKKKNSLAKEGGSYQQYQHLW